MDKVLKQRLIGASILIALAVIFVPMLFHDGGDDAVEQRELSLDLPDRESGDRQVRRLPLDPEQARRPPSDSQAEPPRDTQAEPPVRQREPQPVVEEDRTQSARQQPDDSAVDDGPEAEAEQPEVSDGEAAPERASPEPVERDSGAEQDEVAPSEPETPEQPERGAVSEPESGAEAPVAGDWVVQVAVFSNRETASSIRQRLNELGHRVSMDVLIRNQAELFRLRTGPYADESAADQARGQIAATVAGVDPVTRELSGDGASEERRGLVVQVGSFASHNNAERLVGQLTEAGFDAFMYGEEAGGRTIWRVRVGSYEDRADAERLLETLRDEQGLEGIVVSHP